MPIYHIFVRDVRFSRP